MQKIILFVITTLILAGCSTSLGQPDGDQDREIGNQPGMTLPDLGPAPELNNEIWLNTDQPLRLADLSGKVVLLDMWTFG